MCLVLCLCCSKLFLGSIELGAEHRNFLFEYAHALWWPSLAMFGMAEVAIIPILTISLLEVLASFTIASYIVRFAAFVTNWTAL